MKVLLVKPDNLSDHIQPSLGLAYLAEGIRARHEVIILDCIKEDIDPSEFAQRVLQDFRPDLVGIQCYTFDLGNVRKLLKATKEWNPLLHATNGLSNSLTNCSGLFSSSSFGRFRKIRDWSCQKI